MCGPTLSDIFHTRSSTRCIENSGLCFNTVCTAPSCVCPQVHTVHVCRGESQKVNCWSNTYLRCDLIIFPPRMCAAESRVFSGSTTGRRGAGGAGATCSRSGSGTWAERWRRFPSRAQPILLSQPRTSYLASAHSSCPCSPG